MRKKANLSYQFILLVMLFLITYSCKKDESIANEKTTAEFNPNLIYGTMKDQEGNIYRTIKIGNQIWMAENLRTTKYRDGTPIESFTVTNVNIATTWDNLKTGAYINYNDDVSEINTYGRQYNWYAVIDSHNIAPLGWHIPSYTEWNTLFKFLGGYRIAGSKMKEVGTTHWQGPNYATNESGFTALPATNGTNSSSWWSSTESSNLNVWILVIYGEDTGVSLLNLSGSRPPLFVRCIKD